MSFSIVGYDPKNDDLGVAVQSKFICVGAIGSLGSNKRWCHCYTSLCKHFLGPTGLELLKSGLNAKAVVAKLIAGDQEKENRQVAVIDTNGEAACLILGDSTGSNSIKLFFSIFFSLVSI